MLAVCAPNLCEVRSRTTRDVKKSERLAAVYADAPSNAVLYGGDGLFAAVRADKAEVFDIRRGRILSLDKTVDGTADVRPFGGLLKVTKEGVVRWATASFDETGYVELIEGDGAGGLLDDGVLLADGAGNGAYYGVMERLSALYSEQFGDEVSCFELAAADPGDGGDIAVRVTLECAE